MKQQDQGLLFVELKEPAATRRDVLMATKSILDALRKYEEYKATRAEKQNVLGQLRKVADDLLVLNRKLRSKMPKAPVKIPNFTSTTREKEEKGERTFTGPSPSVARPKSKLDVLQEELAKIESRLSGLE